MIQLNSRASAYHNWEKDMLPLVAKITENPYLPTVVAKNSALLATKLSQVSPTIAGSYRVTLVKDAGPGPIPASLRNVVGIEPGLRYLQDGDVVRIDPREKHLRVLYRRAARFNSLLVTERCNSFCLMCSQPPRKIDDSYLVAEILRVIELADRQTPEIGLTGGEPTLLDEGFLNIIRHARNFLPDTALHVLTNGRRFRDAKFARAVAAIGHPDLMLGIPLYSDQPDIHDFVVQAAGAYDETLKGLLSLAAERIQIELRVVIHRQTYDRLSQLAEFIVRNIPFVDHVALMGLELTGFAKANLKALWIDPYDYRTQLEQAVKTLVRGQVQVKIFNHQLCVVPASVIPYCVRSISDWKNEYLPACESCRLRTDCGGLFGTGVSLQQHSEHIQPFDRQAETAEA
jgi:His-Xaa-Ser system radical SAM maturase HxsC